TSAPPPSPKDCWCPNGPVPLPEGHQRPAACVCRTTRGGSAGRTGATASVSMPLAVSWPMADHAAGYTHGTATAGYAQLLEGHDAPPWLHPTAGHEWVEGDVQQGVWYTHTARLAGDGGRDRGRAPSSQHCAGCGRAGA